MLYYSCLGYSMNFELWQLGVGNTDFGESIDVAQPLSLAHLPM